MRACRGVFSLRGDICFREERALIKQILDLWIGIVEVVRNGEFPFGAPENSGLWLHLNAYEPGDGSARFGDDDFFAQGNTL